MKKYIVMKNFYDVQADVSRWEGQEVELPDARAKQLKSGGYIKEASKTTKAK